MAVGYLKGLAPWLRRLDSEIGQLHIGSSKVPHI